MTTIEVLGVTITYHLSVTDHVRDVISKCSQSLYALKVLWCHSMNDEALRQVYKAVVIAKLLYASPAWWCMRRQQTNSASRRLFDEECDSDCSGLTTQRQRNVSPNSTWLATSRLDTFDVSSESKGAYRACQAVLFQHGGRRTSYSARL